MGVLLPPFQVLWPVSVMPLRICKAHLPPKDLLLVTLEYTQAMTIKRIEIAK